MLSPQASLPFLALLLIEKATPSGIASERRVNFLPDKRPNITSKLKTETRDQKFNEMAVR